MSNPVATGPRLRERLLLYIAVAFLIHGALYFISPDSVRDEQSLIKVLKYLLLALFMLVAWPRVALSRAFAVVSLVALLAFFHLFGVDEPNYINLIQYVAPLCVLPLYEHIRKIDFWRLAVVTLLVSSVLTYVEVWVIRGLYKAYYIAGAYRATSIFVSPNVLGPMVALLTYFVILRLRERARGTAWETARDLVLAANAGAIIVLSGSKTGMMVGAGLAGVFLIARAGIQKAQVMGFGMVALAVVLTLQLSGVEILPSLLDAFTVDDGTFGTLTVREVNFRSGYERLYEYGIFMELARETPLFPWYHRYAYIDNAYMHIWGMFGLPVLLAFLGFNLVLLARALRHGSRPVAITLGLFLVMGLTTNFAFLWPPSYIYWYLVVDVLMHRARAVVPIPATASTHGPHPGFARRFSFGE